MGDARRSYIMTENIIQDCVSNLADGEWKQLSIFEGEVQD